MAREGEHIKVGYTIWPTGKAALGWRVPGAWADPFGHNTIRETALLAERGKLDFYFVGEQYASDPAAQYRSAAHLNRPDSFTTAAYIAGLTKHIGIVATTNTTYADPFLTARHTAQLDWVSNGRALWNIVTGLNPRPAENFGREVHWDNSRRYDWAEEFVQVVTRLWDSWDDDAVVADIASGLLVDPDKVREIGYKGEFFSVRGPLNIGRPPQGQVPILHAGTSERSREYGARFADSRFFNQPNPQYYADVKDRLAKYGRRPDQQVLLAGVTVIVAATAAEARARARQLDELGRLESWDPRVVAADLGLGVPSVPVDVPLSKLDELASGALSGARPIDLAQQNINARPEASDALATLIDEARADLGEEDPTLNDVYGYYVRRGEGSENTVVGDAVQVADWLEERFESYSLDGINTFIPSLPSGLEDLVEHLIPELQRRGRFRTEYEDDTVRERWGLERPASQFDGAALVRPRGELVDAATVQG